MLMLKLSILMSREVGRDVSTPVTVRRESKPLFAARLAALAEWFRLIALTDLARLALLCNKITIVSSGCTEPDV